jgi:Flp pilus assembly CpaF family ATPase
MAGDRTAFACSDGPSLRTAMGPLIAAALEDPDVVEIMLDPDRTLWVGRIARLASGLALPSDRIGIRAAAE